jgi:hypothetical protein
MKARSLGGFLSMAQATQMNTVAAAQAVDSIDSEIDAPEPWEPFETQLVGWSIGLGIAGLVILGTLVNLFLLP